MPSQEQNRLETYLQDNSYEIAVNHVLRHPIFSLSVRHTLLLGKAFYALEKYEQAIDYLTKVASDTEESISYQAQLLIYKAKYLLGQRVDGGLKDLQNRLEGKDELRRVIKEIRDVVEKDGRNINPGNKEALAAEGRSFVQLTLSEQKNGPIQQGMPVFIIPQRWFQCWQAYTFQVESQQRLHPGPITQFQLLDNPYYYFYDPLPQKSYTNYFLFKINRYKLLSKRCWLFLHDRYRGIELKRWRISVSDRTSQTMAQVFLKEVALARQNHRQTFLSVQITKKQAWKGLAKKVGRVWGEGGIICKLKSNSLQLLKEGDVLEESDTSKNFYLYSFEMARRQKKSEGAALNPIQQCVSCKKVSNLRFCQCRLVKYCSMDCLKADRDKHRKRCQLQMIHQKQKSAIIQNFNLDVRQYGGRRGLVGLRNLGNTCYMNSGLQCLSNTQQLTNYFLSNKFLNDINHTNPLGTKGNLACAYAELIRQIWTQNDDYVSPFTIKKMIGKFAPQFSGFGQQDSQEFISYLIDGLQQDLNLVKNKQSFQTRDEIIPDQEASRQSQQNYAKRIRSYVRDLMSGQFKSTVICSSCKKVSICFDPFLLISLPIPIVQQACLYHVRASPQQPVYKLNFPLKNALTCSQLRKSIHSYFGFTERQMRKSQLYFKFIDLKNCTMVKEISEDQGLRFCETYGEWKGFALFCYEIPNQREDIIGQKVCRLEYFHNGQRISFPRYLRVQKDKEILNDVIKTYSRFIKGEQDPNKYLQTIPKIKTDPQTGQDMIQVHLKKDPQLLRYIQKRDFRLSDYSQKSTYSLTDCLQGFSNKQVLQKDNEWYCNKCKEFKPATKAMQIYKSNKILVVAFKRFNRFRKVSAHIQFPMENFDFGPYIKSNLEKKKMLYDLYGVVNHYGSLGGGHYTAYCKNFLLDRWY